METVGADGSRGGGGDHVIADIFPLVNPVVELNGLRDTETIQNVAGGFPLRVVASTTVVQGQNTTSERWEEINPSSGGVLEGDGGSWASRATDEVLKN